MLLRFAGVALLVLSLSGCSFVYDLLAVARDGKLAFIVSSASPRHPSCVRTVQIIAEDGVKAKTQPYDDVARVDYGTFWFESVDHDRDCANEFPLTYGKALVGRSTKERHVAAKPLIPGVVYKIETTTGVNGYGAGRFRIEASGRIENLTPSYDEPVSNEN